MLDLAGFQDITPADSAASGWLKATRTVDGRVCRLKILPLGAEATALTREFELLRDVESPHFVQPLDLLTDQGRTVLVRAEVPGQAIAAWLHDGPLPLRDTLQFALHTCDALSALLRQRWVHKNLNPQTLIWDRDSATVRLTGFGLAQRLRQDGSEIQRSGALEGELAYISPEQTGRSNRLVDYRSDYYSLGIVLYQLLTGRVPFRSDRRLKLVASHLSQQPTPPHEVNPAIPEMVSNIVLKLLEKAAEDRYQSPLGLKADVEQCLQAWDATGEIAPFALAQQDQAAFFQPSQKLYGRTTELNQLLDAFDRCMASGRPQVMLIAGTSGVGKSCLVQELQRPVSSQQGHFIGGKSDPMNRSVPYSAIAPVLSKLLRSLLTEGDEQIEFWRDRLQTAVGKTGQVLVPILPELELLLGPQPPVPELPALEQQNRLKLTFRAFLQAYSLAAHPLVLFLDDLQWADDASLNLLQTLLGDADTSYLLLVGSFRDNEVDAAHPLRRSLGAIAQQGIPVETLTLAPIGLGAIVELLSDLLSADADAVRPLAEIIQQKTNGIPFFVNAFLRSLWNAGVLVFGATGWTWDIERSRRHQATQNVIEAMTTELEQLPAPTLEVLKQVTCLGPSFTLPMLELLDGRSREDTLQRLEPALMNGFLYNEGDTLRFSHDRIREAAYDLLSEQQRDELHTHFGWTLLAYYEQANRLQENLFEVVGQLNLVQSHLSASERHQLAKLNRDAGNRARSAAAYEEALGYFQAAIASLGAADWQRDYSLSREIHLARLECEYLTGHYDRFEQVYAELENRLQHPLELAQLCRLKVTVYVNQGRLKEAVEVGSAALQTHLGVMVPQSERAIKSRLLLEVGRLKLRLSQQTIGRLIDLPEMTDESKRAVMFLMAEMFPAAFVSNPLQFVWMVCYLTRLCLRYGKCNITAQVFLPFTQVLGGALKDYNSAYQFGQLALNLNERYANVQLDSKLRFMFTWFCNHWKRPAQENLEIALEGYRKGAECGDLVFASYSLLSYFHTHLTIGTPLDRVATELQDYAGSLRRMNEQLAIFYNLHCFRNFIRSLRGDNADPLVYEHVELPEYAEDRVVQTLRDRGQLNLLMFYWLYKVELMVLFRQSDLALPLIEQMQPIEEAVMGELAQAEVNFYHSLVMADLAIAQPSTQQPPQLKTILKNQKLMRLWAKHSPDNFEHKRLLIDAEIARLQGKPAEALPLYQSAIAAAQAAGYVQNEAIAQERCAEFLLQTGNETAAMGYLLQAIAAYKRWGATAKVQQLELTYRDLFLRWQAHTGLFALPESPAAGPADSLDTETLVAALSTVSSEIKLENLRHQFLRLVVENSGGERGLLIQEQDGVLVVEDSIDARGKKVCNQPHTPLSDCAYVSQAIVNYVLRTQQSVVVQDAATDELFGQDMASPEARSILCLPIVHQGRLLAVVYLDNSLASGIFTPTRLRLLELLCAQAGISLENAVLYQNLEHKVEERTVQLVQANQEISQLNERLKSENLRMSAELDVTRRLQQMILPQDKELKLIDGLDISGFMEPADEIGGDYYDVLHHDGQIKIGIGDVTGHGLESGVLMLMVQTAIRTLLINNETDYVKFWSTLNRVLYENAQRMNSDRNMTLALLDYQSGSIRLSGQHEEMLVIREGGIVERVDTIDLGFPVGLVSDIADFVNQTEVKLHPGDGVVLYTDGITEAVNANKAMYGLERLCEVVSQNWHQSADEIRRRVIEDVQHYIGEGNKVYDDISLLVLKQKSGS
ncbi:MAG: AAA family ATPase [Cyanobacteria bacterium J069]|nr:MAG: GAF domain-containing protein [Cyanobacteria bacterium J069]